jgi:hypothetical protein
LARDQQFSLVGKMPEERAFRNARALGNLRHGRGIISLFDEEIDGRHNKPFSRSWFPSRHSSPKFDGILVPLLL